MHGARKERSPSETDVDMGGSTLTNHDPMSPIDGLDPIPMSTSVGGMAWAWHVSLSRLGLLLPITISTSLIVLLSRTSSLLFPLQQSNPSKWFHRKEPSSSRKKAQRLWGLRNPVLFFLSGRAFFRWIMIMGQMSCSCSVEIMRPSYLGMRERERLSHQSFFFLSLGFLIPQRRNMIITCF